MQQRRRATQVHHTLRLGAIALDQFGGTLGFHHHGQTMSVVGLADFRYRKMPGRALQQTHAEALLKQGDTPTELGLGHVQGATGGREPAMFDYLGEVIKVVEILHQCSPNRTLRAI
ncbi:hypothetical protein D9M69_556750 [compost metagenome]